LDDQYLTDVSAEVNTALDHDKKVLIEGTQGFGLSLYHSDHYPKTTSRDTTATGFLSEVGVSPLRVTEIVVVFRTFPIRVAGQQAGPLSEEITWEQIQKESGYPDPIVERTSVTQKVRRVGRFDWDLAKKTVLINRPTQIAINGLDYLDYHDFGLSRSAELSRKAKHFIHEIQQRFGVEVGCLGVGPALNHMILQQERTRRSDGQQAEVLVR
jgi:adenylosuccinate synthase